MQTSEKVAYGRETLTLEMPEERAEETMEGPSATRSETTSFYKMGRNSGGRPESLPVEGT